MFGLEKVKIRMFGVRESTNPIGPKKNLGTKEHTKFD